MKKTIDKNGLDEKIGEAVLINVLGEENFANEHIPGSINIPVNAPDFLEQVEDHVASKDEEIVVYCAHEQCSASEQAGDRLEDAGYTNVCRFTGGMKEWKDGGGEIEGRGVSAAGTEQSSGIHQAGSYSCGSYPGHDRNRRASNRRAFFMVQVSRGCVIRTAPPCCAGGRASTVPS